MGKIQQRLVIALWMFEIILDLARVSLGPGCRRTSSRSRADRSLAMRFVLGVLSIVRLLRKKEARVIHMSPC
jgi:hypothetical protein